MATFSKFFEPISAAIIGASRDPQKLGFGVTRNMIASGFKGDLYLINPKGGKVLGRELLTSVNALPEGIDLGLLVVPARYVPETLLACSHKEIKHFIILTGGFSETGAEGAEIEQKVAEIIQAEGLRVIGPNCIGILDTHWPLDTTFIQPVEGEPGDVAFITHSGALGAAMIDWARGAGFSFSRVISLGNQVDVDESDVLIPTAESDETAVITMYLEGISDGEKFVRNAGFASGKKPVLAMKVGRSAAGQKAASSHTGAIAGADHAFDAAFRKAGVLRASTTEEMFSWAKMFAWSDLPDGNRTAVLTNAGGPGVTAVDVIEARGLRMAELSEKTKSALNSILPPAASIANPVDMLASASPQVYADCLEVVLEDEGVDMVLVIAPPPPMFEALEITEKMVPLVGQTQKPVAAVMMGSVLVEEAVEFLREKRVPEFAFPEDAISAMGALWRYREWQDQQEKRKAIQWVSSQDQEREIERISSQLEDAQGFVDPEITAELLGAYGLPVSGLVYANSGDQAVLAAESLGYPVVMKIAVEGVSHKSDIGGILLGLDNNEAVIDGFKQLKRSFELSGNQNGFGVHIQKMIPKGQEVIVGAVRDPIFGPLVMFGGGGTDVEGLKDVAFALAPLSDVDLTHLVESTWAGRKLHGFRNIPPTDIKAVKEILVRVGQVMLDLPQIKEIEINPLILLEEGKGEWVVDARMVL
ncbi:MAG: acetate--CoA ligase family protein [Anaerolineales bacterium]